MANAGTFTEKWKGFCDSLKAAANTTGSVYTKIKSVIGVLVMVGYRLRKVVLAIPVVYYALKIAAYNGEHLPEDVGLMLLANGEFAYTVSRYLAVMGPLVLTGGCLVMMLFSRKALYPWAISIFTLILPLLLLVSNIYPA
jgi:hypothetical protein